MTCCRESRRRCRVTAPAPRLDLHIEPEEAFGDFNDQLLFLEPRKLFPAEVEEGMTIEGSALPKGTNPDAPRNALYTVTEITPSTSCWTATTRWRALRSA
jgi:hypothetical protein